MSEHDNDTCPHLVQASLLETAVARLKAEVERLDTLCKQLMAQHSDISCENIMLRKAGDAVALDYAERIEIEAGNPAKTLMKTVPVLREWQAAKEGKPSETKSPSFIEDLGNGVEKHDLLFRYPAKKNKPSV